MEKFRKAIFSPICLTAAHTDLYDSDWPCSFFLSRFSWKYSTNLARKLHLKLNLSRQQAVTERVGHSCLKRGLTQKCISSPGHITKALDFRIGWLRSMLFFGTGSDFSYVPPVLIEETKLIYELLSNSELFWRTQKKVFQHLTPFFKNVTFDHHWLPWAINCYGCIYTASLNAQIWDLLTISDFFVPPAL